MADGQVVFEISADGKKAYAAIEDVTRAMEKAGKDWEATAEKSSDGMTKSFAKALDINRIKDWALKAGKALLDFGMDAIQAASDLEEVQNVVDVTFGSSASQIDSWAKNAITQFGLTETKAKQFASTLGAMMKSAGVSGDSIVSMSEDLAGLAADMASFYNLDFDTAFQKIRSGISGETEPLKQLGINMSVANLEAFALKQGLEKTFEQMTQGEQTMLRYQYIMQATADAQGDFSRTSDGFANSQRLLASNFEQLKTTVGGLLVGPLADLTSWANDTLAKLTTPAEKTALDKFNEIDLDTAKKLAELENITNEAYDLIGVLEEVSAKDVKADNFQTVIEQVAADIGLLGNELQSAQNGNFTGKVSEIAGSLGVLAGGANALNAYAQKRWEGLFDAFGGDDSDDFIKVLDAAGKNDYSGVIDGMAASLSSITGVPEGKWQTLLGEIGKLPDMSGSSDVTGFLNAASEAAKKLGGEYPGYWQQLIDALGEDKAAAMVKALSGGKDAGTYLGLIAESANKLDASSKQHWEAWMNAVQKVTGKTFGNNAKDAQQKIKNLARALSGEDVNQSKAEAFQGLISTLVADSAALAELGGTDQVGVVEFLQNMAQAANDLEPDNAAGWDTLLTALATGFSGQVDSEAGKTFRDSMAEYFLSLGSGSDAAVAGLKALGYSTDEIEESQKQWLTTVQKLAKTIPGLSDIVNTETGAVEGGADALRDYVAEYKRQQEGLLMWKAFYAKKEALLASQGELFDINLDVIGANQKVKRLWEAAMNKAGADEADFIQELYANGRTSSLTMSDLTQIHEFDEERMLALNELANALIELNKAEAKYQKHLEAASEAEQQVIDLETGMEEKYGDTKEAAEEAANGTKHYATVVGEEAVNATSALSAALSELENYMNSVKQATENSVDGVIKGFASVETPAEKARKNVADLGKEIQKALAEGKDTSTLIKSQGDAQAAIPTINNMTKALREQLDYMQEYQRLMAEARAKGVSEDILAMLSDGSLESFDYLQALASGAGDIEALNAVYAQVQAEKGAFVDALTESKLKADDAYDELAAKAQAAVEALNKEEEARGAAADTIEGIVTGLAQMEPSLTAEVDNILAILDRLGNWNGYNTKGFRFAGNLVPANTGEAGTGADGEEEIHFNANGLEYVPYDNFFSVLHEGESVLTAAEARVWRGIKNGGTGNSFDFDALGSTISSNMRGGNVYLDGQIVGRIISDRQGDSYRALERSGWQG